MAGLMYGADADELEAIAKELDQYEQELGQLLLEGVGAVSLVGLSATLNSIWKGPRSTEFAGIWEARHLLRIRDVQATLNDTAKRLRDDASEQRRASSGAGGSFSNGATSSQDNTRKRSDRLDSHEARQEILDGARKYLEISTISSRYPEAAEQARLWLARLDENSTPGEVAAFEKYMALLKAAGVHEVVVRNSAEYAMEQYIEAGKSGGAAIAGGATLQGESAIGDHVLNEIYEGGMGFAQGSIADLVAGSGSLPEAAGEAAVLRHRAEVDAVLADSVAQIEQYTTVGFTDPDDLMNAQRKVVASQLAEARAHGAHADAFVYITGDGSAIDGALRTGLKAVGGGPLSKALSGLEIVGNTAQAGYHITAAHQALLLSGSGIDQLFEGFAALDGR